MQGRNVRYLVIALVLILGVAWSVASAQDEEVAPGYPEAGLLVDAAWLKDHMKDDGLVVVDVRRDKDFDGQVIPGAIRLPWSEFRHDDAALNQGGLFVGPEQAQKILGSFGLARGDAIVLYDSVKSDGGATASYVFWVLDVLGHKSKMLLARGIDGWTEAGFETAKEPRKADPILYQAPVDEIRLDRWVDGRFIQARLGDPYYQILDVRSPEEYLGQTPNPALDNTPLKAGHIPTSYNYNYKDNWADKDTKALKSYPELQNMYRGLNPNLATITYCHSARRGSFSYFVLRLMGFKDVKLYDASWFEWGAPRLYFPVETQKNVPAGTSLPQANAGGGPSGGRSVTTPASGGEAPSGGQSGYISCGG